MLSDLYETIASSHPKLTRGQVWCHSCGETDFVDPGACLRFGWPKCCNATMSIDSPAERAALQQENNHAE